MKKVIIILFVCLGTISFSQTVTIGTQVWMTKNLDVSTFRNGDPIPEAKTPDEWFSYSEAKQPAWCYYDNNPKNGEKYGKLYNWYAVSDPRGLAPEGWHVPNNDEMKVLEIYLGRDKAGVKMKSKKSWVKKGNGNNRSGFLGLPGGYCTFGGAFDGIGYFGNWWSSTEHIYENAALFALVYNYDDLRVGKIPKYFGHSVRCIKD
jgi:uncharacterized protein (TIGR02145 family)